MAPTDNLTDNDWSSSFDSSDERSVDSIRNPYIPAPPHSSTNTPSTTNSTGPQHTTPSPTTGARQPPITQWLTKPNTTVPRATPTPAPKLPTTKLKQLRHTRSHIQLPLHDLLDNNHWGDIPSNNPAIFRVISKNVNSLSTTDNNLQWCGAAQALYDLDAHILCLQEPNTHWTAPILRPIYRLFQKTFMHAKFSTSASIDVTDSNRQPGGTFLAVVGCYASRVLTTGSDTSGLGRWAYCELVGRNGRRFLIITAYRVGDQQPTIGSTKVYTQQYQILLEQGDLNPNPRAAFVTDIIAFIQQWQSTHDILLCMDTNDSTIRSKDRGLETILAATKLIDLHQYRFPSRPTPATHNRGTKTIDYCLGSPGFAEALTGAWMLPFGLPPTLTGDHRTLGLEFDHDVLFGLKIPYNDAIISHGVYSNAYPTVRKFNDDVAAACEKQGLFQAARILSHKYTFTPSNHAEMERIDQALTAILVTTDRKFAKHKNTPWSPELHQAFLTHCYWRIRLTQERTRHDHSTPLQSIAAKMTTEPATNGSVSQNLRVAQQRIREIRREAALRRETHLQELTDAADNTDDKAKRKLILHLKLAEQNRKCFAIHRNFMKPRSAGGLTHLRIPADTQPNKWQTVIEPRAMETHLIEYCRIHFQQAQGSPYTVPPLSTLLNYDSLTPFGSQVLHGTADLNALDVSHHTKLLLQHQKMTLPSRRQRFHNMPFEAMLDGFRKWPERTSTSPSGRHLGIYKSLAKDANKKQSKKKPNSTTNRTQTNQTPKAPKHNGAHVLQIIHQLLVMAVNHCHTMERWTTIWNFFIEKELGNPRIDKLRALHLLEADYNLLLKWFGPKGFIKVAEDNQQLTDFQGGGRRGRSAIDLACKKVATYDYLLITRTIAANFEHDLQHCFDNMNEACQNLSCRQQGADHRYIKLHAQTQRQLKYFVKHAYGVSDTFNQYSEQNPWHGAGQGTGDAAPRWVVQSHSLITAYHAEAKLWSLPNPTTNETLTMGIDAFMDDTNHLLGNPIDDRLSTILPDAQYNLDLWQGLIQASGGTLNPAKCSWTPFLWHYDRHGEPRLVDPPPRPQYHMTAPDRHGVRHTLHRNKPADAVRLLGVHIAADGNCAKELNVLRSRQSQYCSFLQRTPLTRREAKVIYRQCYLPKVSYPLPATTMPPDQIYKTQSTVTSLFLNKMGYP